MTVQYNASVPEEVLELYSSMLFILGALDRLGLFQAGAYLSMAMEMVRSRHPDLVQTGTLDLVESNLFEEPSESPEAQIRQGYKDEPPVCPFTIAPD